MVAAARKGAALLLLLNRASERATAAEAQIAAEAPAGTEVVTVDCDLQSFASVRAAAAEVAALVAPLGGLDVLMNK